jgi:NADH dehydrogenase FAD-containing subunit
MAEIPHVIILGVGFGGIGALKKLRDANSGLRSSTSTTTASFSSEHF